VTGRCPACAWKALRGERRPVVLPEPESDWRPVLGLLLVLLAIVSVLAVLRRQVADNDARAWSSLPPLPAGEEPSEP
jgi:hypothetical protein